MSVVGKASRLGSLYGLSFFLPSLPLSLPPSFSSSLPSIPPSSFLQVFIARPMCKGSRSGPVVTVTLIIFCSGGQQIHNGWWERKAVTG